MCTLNLQKLQHTIQNGEHEVCISMQCNAFRFSKAYMSGPKQHYKLCLKHMKPSLNSYIICRYNLLHDNEDKESRAMLHLYALEK